MRLSVYTCTVFASELADPKRAVMVASSQGGCTTVADIDLRSAPYLAGRLLATLYGVAIEQVTGGVRRGETSLPGSAEISPKYCWSHSDHRSEPIEDLLDTPMPR
jgi:hypothetical protein